MSLRALLKNIDSSKVDLRRLDKSNPSPFRAYSSSETHKGLVRLTNEDACLELASEKLWLVADGMGGHKRGDYASKAIVNAMQSFSRQVNPEKESLIGLIDDLQKRLVEANNVCQHAFRAKRIGSTVALMFEFNAHCFFLWAGDSRIYRLRAGRLSQMTRDHSLAQEKLNSGELNQDEAEAHPSAHILTRAVGVHRHLKLELLCSPILPNDRFLLCTDGLYGSISVEDLRRHLLENPQEVALEGLLTSALNNGGRDNITALIVDFQ